MERRKAARVVLLDEDNRVAIICVNKLGYYKIPGGGIEEGESPQDAARREASEESGCDCSIIAELGQSETALPGWGMLDLSQGFLARIEGKKHAPQYEDHEQERGFALKWFPSLNDAIETISSNTNISDPDAAKLQARDLSYLKLAQAYLKEH